jgi:hypothetical protein
VVKKLSAIAEAVEEEGGALLSDSNVLIGVGRWPEGLEVESDGLLKIVGFIIIMISRSLISSSISYLAVSASGVSIISMMLLISSRRAKPVSRSWGSYSWLSLNVTSLVRNTLSMLGIYIL